MTPHRDDASGPERETALLEENARLRAALTRAGIDVEQVLAGPPRQHAEADPAAAAADTTTDTGGSARRLDEDLRRTSVALAASEAALTESQSRLAGIFQMKTLGVMVWGPDFRLIDVNEALLAMTGFRREELLGLTWQDLTPEEFHPPSYQAVEQLHCHGETIPYEKQYFRRDGSRWWGLFAARKVDSETVEVVLDVSARRQVEESLRDSEEQLRLIVESTRDYAIFTLDADGLIAQWWPGAAAVFGWSASEAIGQPSSIIFTPEDRASHQPQKEMAMARSLGAAPDVRWHVRRDGTRVFIEGHLSPLRARDGELRGYLKIGQDVTERWAAEEQLRQSEAALRHLNETLEVKVSARTAELEHAVEALRVEALDRVQAEEALRQAQKMEAVGQLTGGLAHDFNNLLTGIIGSLDMVNRRVAQGRYTDLDRYIAAARGASDRAAALTHRLLAFSRRQTLAPRPTDLNALVHGMLDLLRRSIGPHIALEVVGAENLWTTLCDPNQLENALLNLCINARDAMPAGGRLTLATGNDTIDSRRAKTLNVAPGRYVALHVTDTGTGMPPEVIARAFDPFFTTKPQGQGTGLGLSMVYGFARQSGGQVQIESSTGQGTTVTVYLPMHEGRAEREQRVPEAEDAVHAGAHETVLVVDDEPTVRMLIGEVLRDLGYSALEAADGASGLRILESQARVDLLVTDVGMPGGINGRQLVDRARVRRPGLKVLFITGYAEHTALGTLEPGMQVMPKPFAMQALAARIHDMLQSGQAP